MDYNSHVSGAIRVSSNAAETLFPARPGTTTEPLSISISRIFLGDDQHPRLDFSLLRYLYHASDLKFFDIELVGSEDVV